MDKKEKDLRQALHLTELTITSEVLESIRQKRNKQGKNKNDDEYVLNRAHSILGEEIIEITEIAKNEIGLD